MYGVHVHVLSRSCLFAYLDQSSCKLHKYSCVCEFCPGHPRPQRETGNLHLYTESPQAQLMAV